jgi:hypothetical protein
MSIVPREVVTIWCCTCQKDVPARLTDGREIYPHRPDLAALPFWRCDDCKNYVGCHHKTADRTKPLGVIPSNAVKQLRMQIHATIDSLWKGKLIGRRALYAKLSRSLGREYHTAELRTAAEAKAILAEAKAIRALMKGGESDGQ